MKPEHKAIIERAKLADVPASYIAHELLVHDLVESGLFELKNLHSPYGKLNEGQQQEVIDRLTEAATAAAHNAIAIISSRNVSTIEVTMKEVKFNSKQLTLTSIVDAKDPNRHDLIDSAGRLCLLVMAPDDYAEGLDFIQPDRDQPDLPLHVSELTGSLFDGATGPDETDGMKHPLGTEEELNALVNSGLSSNIADGQVGSRDPLYSEATEQLIAYGRLGAAAIAGALSISNERASLMLNAMVESGVAVAVDGGNVFEINGGGVDASFKEFGDFTYDDAKQLIVLKAQAKPFKAHWVQSRLAIDSDQVATLLLRLLDDKVIEIETEGDSAFDHSFKVIATLEDVV